MDQDRCCALLSQVLTKECSSSLNTSTRMRSSCIRLAREPCAPTFQCEAPETDWDAYLLSLAAPAQTTVPSGSPCPAFPFKTEVAFKLKEGSFRLDIQKKLISLRAVRYYNWLTRKSVCAPFLEFMKARFNGVLDNLVSWRCSCPLAVGVGTR